MDEQTAPTPEFTQALPPEQEPLEAPVGEEQAEYEPQFADYQTAVPQEQTLLFWKAPSRAYKKHDREYYTTIAVIVFLLSVILFFAGQFLPIAVVVAAGFLSYVMASVPPTPVDHEVTTFGVRTMGKMFYWGELSRFWFTERFKQKILNIERPQGLPGRLVLLLGDLDQKDVEYILSQFLVKQTPLPSFVDKAANWLQEKFPLERQ